MKTMKGMKIKREEIENYIYIEKEMNELSIVINSLDSSYDKWHVANKRFDSLEEKLNNQVYSAIQSYGITTDDFINQVNKFSEVK